MIKFENSWDKLLEDEFKKDYYQKLRDFLISEYRSFTIYPLMHDIFNAFKLTDYYSVKVVILGQDPYHGAGQAHGLAFSVKDGVTLPPSLKNIYKEIEDTIGIKMTNNGNLTKWANQGVLLLNTVLTVRSGMANSHQGKGWEIFTDNVIRLLNEREEQVIFVLWGNNAKQKMKLITNSHHFILSSVHPSPLSAFNGFFGCGHFLKINEILKNSNRSVIDWKI